MVEETQNTEGVSPIPEAKKETGAEIETEADVEIETGGNISVETGGGFASPEGILMLSVAILLDLIGLTIFILGTWFAIDDYGVLDILGMTVIGGWMLMRSGGVDKTIIKKGVRRFVTASVIELIPFLGGASPTWIWVVYKTLKS